MDNLIRIYESQTNQIIKNIESLIRKIEIKDKGFFNNNKKINSLNNP
jgi:hypothetical protein